MEFQVGQEVVFSAKVGKILSLEAAKRGKNTLAIVEFPDRTIKVSVKSLLPTGQAGLNWGFNPGWSKSGTGA